jgi:hypothetical protein
VSSIVLMVTGSLWPVTGDDEGALANIGGLGSDPVFDLGPGGECRDDPHRRSERRDAPVSHCLTATPALKCDAFSVVRAAGIG